MAKKFIINDGRLIMGHVQRHRELAQDHRRTIGGGYWHMENDTLYLYGQSTDFGPTTEEIIKQSSKPPTLSNLNIVFSPEEELEDIKPKTNGTYLRTVQEHAG